MGPADIPLLIHLKKFGLNGQPIPGSIGQIESLLTGIMKGYQREDPPPFRVDIIEGNGYYCFGGMLVVSSEVLPIGGTAGELARLDELLAGVQGPLPLRGTGIDLCIQVKRRQNGLGRPIIWTGIGGG